MILVIDNYDSFTYNLVQYLGELGEEVKVFRNDEISIQEIEALAPDHILISPDLVRRTKPASVWKCCSISRGSYRSLESVSDIRLSDRLLAAMLSVRSV